MDIPLLGGGGNSLPNIDGGIDKDELENGPRDQLLVSEVWRPVLGWEDRYEVSSLGRVRSLPRRGGNNRWYGGKMLSCVPGHGGYPIVSLCRPGVDRTTRVHVLVAEAFHGPMPDGAQCVRHLDGNPSYNTPWNCVWGTDSENMQDAVRHGTHFWASKDTCKYGHPLVQQGSQRKCPVCQSTFQKNYKQKIRSK